MACLLGLSACETMSGTGGATDADLSGGILQSAQSSEAEGRYAVAVVQYRKLYARDANDPDVVLGLARNLRYTGDAASAMRILASSDGMKNEQPAFLLESAKAEIAGGAPSRAIDLLSKARILDEENWDVHGTLGIAYDMVDAYGDAATAYARALELSPGNPAVFNNMAISAALSGDLDRGIEILESAALSVRRDPQIRQNLALLYGLQGQDDKARSLSRMSLAEEDVRNNLSVYSRLRSGHQHEIK